MAGHCEYKRSILFLEKRMAGRCETNRSVFLKNDWALQNEPKSFFKEMAGQCKINQRSFLRKKIDWSL